tara:strand:+ start:136 stop:426 length:291 start_codon:yes stop_codon:yes gene_type:complete
MNEKEKFYESLEDSRRQVIIPTNVADLPTGIYDYVKKLLFMELNSELYEPDLIVLPLTVDSEHERESLYSTFNYGCKEYNVKYKKELFNVIIATND